MGSATGDSKTAYNYAHTTTPKAASSHRYTAAKKNDKPTAAATVARTRYLSSSPAATLHGKTQGFVLRLPPQNITHATSCSHSNAICNRQIPKQPLTTHTQPHPKQLQATVTLRQKKTTNRPQPQPPHRRGTFHRLPAATLHGKTQGFVLQLPPQNIAHATSCSHSNGICNHRFQNTL